jgi:putative membrane protein
MSATQGAEREARSKEGSSALPAERPFWVINVLVSITALGVLAYLLLVRHGSPGGGGSDLSFMPAVNATSNAVSATFLVLAVRAIRKKKQKLHRNLILCAFAASAFFLVGYLAYHYVHGDTKYPGTGTIRVLYLLFLASHVILSVPVVPLCLAAFYYALKAQYATHRKITRFLYPIWLYVSVTGVLVFVWLRLAFA